MKRAMAFGLTAWAMALTVATTPAHAIRLGDCNGDGNVGVAEILTMLSIALGHASVGTCLAGDSDGDGTIDIAEIMAAFSNAMCSGPCLTPVPTVTPTPVPTATLTPPATATPTPAPTAIGLCGNGVLEPTEQCDSPADAACPGRCQPPATAGYDCVECGSATGTCSGPVDPACTGQCVLRAAPCTCTPSVPASCPPPQTLPNVGAPYFCPADCAQIGARLYYREQTVGSTQFTEQEIELLGFPDPTQPSLIKVHVRTTTPDGSTSVDTLLDFGGGTGSIIPPPGANALFGGLRMYNQLVCGWPLGCTPDGSGLIPNGQLYEFEADVGFGQHDYITTSCSGCGGGTTRVNASWAGVRCGTDSFTKRPVLCRGFNPYIPASFAPQCCGCTGDGPCPSGTACVDSTCQ